MLNYQRVSFSFPSRVLETRDVAHEGADLPAQDWGCLAHRKLGYPPNFFPNPVAYYGLLWPIMVVTMAVYSGLFSYSWSCSLTGEKNCGDILVKSHVHRRFPWRWSKWNSPFGPPFNHSTCTSNSSQMRVAALMVASWLGWTPFWLCKKAGMKWAWIPSQGFA